MNCLRHQNYKNENTSGKDLWNDWLINYIFELVKIAKLRVFLKQRQSTIIIN